MIELNNVSKKYLNQNVLEDVTLSINKGNIVGVIGANGSGKSTLLKIIAGLIKPTKGQVSVNNLEVDRRSSSFIAFLSELDDYYPFYTVKETIKFYADQFVDFDLNKAYQILEFMKLSPDKKVKDLSKGSRARLKMVLALSRSVPVILMDEPLSGLDPMVRESIVKGLISFIDIEKQTVVITTHEVTEIEPLLDKVVLIKDGRFIKMVSVDAIKEEEKISIIEWMKKVYK